MTVHLLRESRVSQASAICGADVSCKRSASRPPARNGFGELVRAQATLSTNSRPQRPPSKFEVFRIVFVLRAGLGDG